MKEVYTNHPLIKKLKVKADELWGDIQFEEESHSYKLYDINSTSVSSFVKIFGEEFDNSRFPASRVKQWDAKMKKACERGHKLHNYAQHVFESDRPKRPSSFEEFEFRKFWDATPDYYIPLFSELKMYHPTFDYFGTTDKVFLDIRDESLVVCDYKTNEDIFKNYQEKTLYEPFSDMLDSPYSKYVIQLSSYELMLSQLGLPISKRMIVWFPHNMPYEVYFVPSVTDKIMNYVSGRSN